MTITPLLAALVSLCTIWITADGQHVLHRSIRRMGGVSYLHKVEVNVDAVAEASGVPRFLLARMAHGESGFDPKKRSPAGALGLMQMLPGTPHFREWRRVCALSAAECTQANLLIGARELAWHWRICGGGWELAVARYRGAGCVARDVDKAVVDDAEQLRRSSLDLVISLQAAGGAR